MQIKDKIIIVTGASQGIGLAAANLLASKGAKVVLAARSEDVIKKLERELPGSFAVPTDMRSEADIQVLITKTIKHYGRIDVLINNAGQGMYGPVEKTDIEKYKSMFELNVVGVLRAMQAVIPHMRVQESVSGDGDHNKKTRGIILNISSRVSKNYFPNLGAYASTKYALNALSLTARGELAPENITVSVMHPKLTATDFGKNAYRAGDFTHPRPSDRPGMQADTAEQVAEKIAGLIESEEPEAEM
jgi:short-subunit dehydrogenase